MWLKSIYNKNVLMIKNVCLDHYRKDRVTNNLLFFKKFLLALPPNFVINLFYGRSFKKFYDIGSRIGDSPIAILQISENEVFGSGTWAVMYEFHSIECF